MKIRSLVVHQRVRLDVQTRVMASFTLIHAIGVGLGLWIQLNHPFNWFEFLCWVTAGTMMLGITSRYSRILLRVPIFAFGSLLFGLALGIVFNTISDLAIPAALLTCVILILMSAAMILTAKIPDQHIGAGILAFLATTLVVFVHKYILQGLDVDSTSILKFQEVATADHNQYIWIPVLAYIIYTATRWIREIRRLYHPLDRGVDAGSGLIMDLVRGLIWCIAEFIYWIKNRNPKRIVEDSRDNTAE